MNAQYQIMTFAGNGNPMPVEIRKHSTKEEAVRRMNELKKVYEVPMMVRQVK